MLSKMQKPEDEDSKQRSRERKSHHSKNSANNQQFKDLPSNESLNKRKNNPNVNSNLGEANELLTSNKKKTSSKADLNKQLLIAVTLHPERHEAVEQLLKQGADPNSTDSLHRTPLHLLMIPERHHKGLESLKLLVKHADVNATCMEKQTPLHVALWGNETPNKCTLTKQPSFSAIKCLLGHGAKVNVINTNGETPIKLAFKFQFEPKIVQILLEFGSLIKLDTIGHFYETFDSHQHRNIDKVVIKFRKIASFANIKSNEISNYHLRLYKIQDKVYYQELFRFKRVCTSELTKMKNEFLSPNVTLFDLFFGVGLEHKEYSVGMFKSLYQMMNINNYPIYSDVFTGIFREYILLPIWIKIVLDPDYNVSDIAFSNFKSSLLTLTFFKKLYHLQAWKKIVNFLSYTDIYYLVVAADMKLEQQN